MLETSNCSIAKGSNSMNIYYVYAYLRKKDLTPYYIGKGKNKRAYQKHGNVPIPTDKKLIKFYHTNLLEEDALNLEKEYIKLFGRKHTNTGILINFTDGGEGTSGIKSTPEKIAKIISTGRANNSYIRTSEQIAKQIATAKANNSYVRTKESLDKAKITREQNGTNKQSKEHIRNRVEARKNNNNYKHSEETKKNLCKINKDKKRSVESIEKMKQTNILTNAYARGWQTRRGEKIE
jgi:hypothetical protein